MSSSSIDVEVGATNIANLFADQYSSLFNQKVQDLQLENLMTNINQRLSSADFDEVNRITEPIVTQAIKRLKRNKADAVFDFYSDCLIEGPKELITHLTYLLKLIVMHGTVPSVLLMCNITALVKDSLGVVTSSSNYRPIATACQVLKLLDLVILLLEGDRLKVWFSS